jgi:prevent-host-death family protein
MIGAGDANASPAFHALKRVTWHFQMTSDMTIGRGLLVTWPVFDAKARFSEFLDTTLKEGPQVVTRRGVETAVLVSMEEWKRLQASARHPLVNPLLDPGGPRDLYIPPRRTMIHRPIVPFSDDE